MLAYGTDMAYLSHWLISQVWHTYHVRLWHMYGILTTLAYDTDMTYLYWLMAQVWHTYHVGLWHRYGVVIMLDYGTCMAYVSYWLMIQV